MTTRADLIGEAAERRASLYRARKDRPSQRRASEHPHSLARATFTAQCRAGAYDGMTPSGGYWSADDGGAFSVGDTYFTGLASSTNSPYEMYDQAGPYDELVAPGAFKQSLALGAGLDVPLVLQHDDLRRIARTTIPAGQPGHLALAETQLGLACRAQLDPSDPDVQYILPKLASGLVSEMSFRFVIDSGEWSPDFSQYVIHSANLQRGDVSICGYGANPNTFASATTRSAPEPMDERAERRLLEQLRKKYELAPVARRSFLVTDDDLR
jgi:Escherichia/Staphylococcus phage prohead protease